MNRTPRLSESGIEYLDYIWSFYSGCWNWKNEVCPVGENCWAKGITVRFPDHYPNGFEPTYYPEAFLSPLHLKKPSIIGCAFMGDLFGDWVDPHKPFPLPERRSGWIDTVSLKGIIYQVIRACPQHTFLFLTKCPWNLPKWSPFPDNCYVGVTATNDDMFWRALHWLKQIEARVKYISVEPHLEYIRASIYELKGIIHWIIDGAQTKPYKPPRIEWVEEIVRAADKAGVLVFLKDNLVPLLAADPRPEKAKLFYSEMGLRQELPCH